MWKHWEFGEKSLELAYNKCQSNQLTILYNRIQMVDMKVDSYSSGNVNNNKKLIMFTQMNDVYLWLMEDSAHFYFYSLGSCSWFCLTRAHFVVLVIGTIIFFLFAVFRKLMPILFVRIENQVACLTALWNIHTFPSLYLDIFCISFIYFDVDGPVLFYIHIYNLFHTNYKQSCVFLS